MSDIENIEKQYYTIGEVAETINENPSLIRFWESKFTLLKPRKNRKGNRIYTHKDIDLIKQIHYLVKVKGFTLKGAEEKIKKASKEVEINQKSRETLIKLKDFLVDLKNAL